MTETLVRAEKTILPATDVYLALRDQWVVQVGSEPTRPQLLTMMAQVWLETGTGQSSYGYNLGGIKYTKGCGHDYYQVQTHELIGGVMTEVKAEFRSYASLADAAADYVHLLRTTFGYAWPAIESADIEDYAHRLHLRGYYTADEHDYAAGLIIRYKQLNSQIPEDTVPEVPIAIARSQPPPGTDTDDQPLPPSDLPDPDAA